MLEQNTTAAAPDDFSALLSDSISAETRQIYTDRLLQQIFEQRDNGLAARLAQLADESPAQRAALFPRLEQALNEQPDAVYAFVRAYAPSLQAKVWLDLLQRAARHALDVAIQAADSTTLIQWLTLIAREPAHYGLLAVLEDGLLLAQTRAQHEPDLARELLILAAKRVPLALETFLEDADLMQALPNNFGAVLRDMNGDALKTLQLRGYEVFFVALARAAQARNGTMFTQPVVAQIWQYYIAGEQIPQLATQYQPASIIHALIAAGATLLSAEVLEYLDQQIISCRRADIVQDMFKNPAIAKALLPAYLYNLAHGKHSVKEVSDMVFQLVDADNLAPQQATDFFCAVLDEHDWQEEYLPLMHELLRWIQPDINMDEAILWHISTAGVTFRDTHLARGVLRPLLALLETQTDDVALVENLRRISTQTRWDDEAHALYLKWWRGYIRSPHAKGRLQRWEKLLEGKRGLEEERESVATLLALRKVFAQRKLSDFAEQVKISYALLNCLADAFDPDTRRNLDFDTQVIDEELSGRDDQLPPADQRILANNLKELAHLIEQMGDNRSRALLRSEDALERDIISGEQPPHSTVDMLKWLHGFWDEQED